MYEMSPVVTHQDLGVWYCSSLPEKHASKTTRNHRKQMLALPRNNFAKSVRGFPIVSVALHQAKIKTAEEIHE